MNYRVIIIAISILLSTGTITHGQEVTIHFDIYNSTHPDSDTLSPYLRIRYTNNSSINYYFPSLAYEGSIKPLFGYPGSSVRLHRIPYDTVIDLLREYRGTNYCMPLLFIKYKKGEMLSLSIDNGKEVEEYAFINHILAQYYNEERPLIEFSRQDLKRPCFLKRCPAFIFLKAGHTKEQLISLAGIKEAGVQLRVYLADNQAPTTVQIGQRMWDVQSLPNVVKGYRLYKGLFKSNELSIDFSNYSQPTVIDGIL